MLSKLKTVGLGVAARSGAAVGGAAVAGAATSNSGSTSTPAAAAHPPPGLRNMPAPGTSAHEDAEQAVTGDPAAKAQAAAVKAAGGGTAGEVTTDYFGNGYEVTVTQADDSSVEIHLDGSFEVMGRPAGWSGALPSPSGSVN